MKKKLLAMALVMLSAVLLVSCKDNASLLAATDAANGLSVPASVSANFDLPSKVGEASITWTSNNAALKVGEASDDKVTITVTQADDAVTVKLTGTAKVKKQSFSKDFSVVVEETYKGDAENAEAVLTSLSLPGKTVSNLTLPTTVLGTPVTWATSDAEVISSTGSVTQSVKNKAAKLTATVTDGPVVKNREFWVTVYGSEVDLDASYVSAYSEIQTLNPLMSTGVSDSDVWENLVGTLYGGDYDWYKAMDEGHADYPGDFSKIRSDRNPTGTVEMPSLAYTRTLGMAAAYPFAVNEETDNAIEGSYGVRLDNDKAKETLDTEWIITIKKGLVFADNTPINADTYEYAFKQYLNGDLKNERANYLYNGDYIPLVNGKEYYDGEVEWSEVGFEKIDDHSFKIELTTLKTQYNLIGYLNMINLVHVASFEAGFNTNGTENNYGSIANPLVSYGPFTLANTYDTTNKFEFTRNDKYFNAWDVPFKHIGGPIITDQSAVINEFKAGNIDVAGVGGEYWDEFHVHKNLYVSPSNSFYRLAISLERPEGKAKPILQYAGFRRALYLATDRNDFANNVQPPSQGALGYLSNIHQVSEWATQAYAASSQFKQQLEELGLAPEQGGYDSEEALALFTEARAEAVAAGEYAANEKIVIEFLYYDAGSNTRIANWVKEQYEKVFNDGKAGNPDFEVILKAVSSAELNAQRAAGDFDLIFTGMSGATFQATFGMGYIFSPTYSSFLVGKGHGVPTLEVEADIINLFAIIAAKEAHDEDAVEANEGKVPEGMRTESEQEFFELLEATDGVFSGAFDELFDLYSATPELDIDYEGQEEDLINITAALEKALLNQMIAVPLFSSTSAAVYSDKVVRLAHAYHLFLGWGGMSYMYKTK